jgi:hypothetical protein
MPWAEMIQGRDATFGVEDDILKSPHEGIGNVPGLYGGEMIGPVVEIHSRSFISDLDVHADWVPMQHVSDVPGTVLWQCLVG